METHDVVAAMELTALVQIPGALRFITNEHACGAGKYPGRDGFDTRRCEEVQRTVPLTDPKHFVIHDVVRIEGPDARGRVRAWTAEGDWCEGMPSAVLHRLREVRGDNPATVPPAPAKGAWHRVLAWLNS